MCRRVVVVHVDPVAHVATVAVERHLLAIEQVGGEQRDDLLGELVGAEVVAAPSDHHGEAVGGDVAERDEVAAGLGRATFAPGLPRGSRSQSAEGAVALLLERGANINAVNEADFTALHGAAFRGLNEVIEFLVAHGANINARDFRGRTPYRLAEGAKQSFQFQAYANTAAYIKSLGADTTLGVPGTVQERMRDIPAAGPTNNVQP